MPISFPVSAMPATASLAQNKFEQQPAALRKRSVAVLYTGTMSVEIGVEKYV